MLKWKLTPGAREKEKYSTEYNIILFFFLKKAFTLESIQNILVQTTYIYIF